jgi:hypothetical protein
MVQWQLLISQQMGQLNWQTLKICRNEPVERILNFETANVGFDGYFPTRSDA